MTIRRTQEIRHLALAAMALAVIGGCRKGPNGQDEVGHVQARLVSESAGDDVVAVRVDVTQGGGTVESQTVRLRPNQPVPEAGFTLPGGDAFFTLRPGLYGVVATPLRADGSPSKVCTKGTASALVKAQVTTEIVVAMLCGEPGRGGLDVVVVLKHQPIITKIALDPGKFIDTCQPLKIQATAVDPDGDPLSWSWTISGAPPGALATLSGGGSRADFHTRTPGDYEISVEARDPSGQSAGIAFPVYVAGKAVEECPEPEVEIFVETNEPGSIRPSDSPTVIRSRNVLVDVSPLRPPHNQVVKLPLFADTTFSAVGIRMEPAGPDGFVWIGHLVNQPRSLVVLSVQPGALAGHIQTDKGELYLVRFAGNGVHRISQVDPRTFKPELDPTEIRPVPPADEDPCGGTEAGGIIDLMVVYTSAARSSAGGTEPMLALVYLSVSVSNQSYFNSSVSQRLRLVHVMETSYAETGNVTTERDRLQNPSDGFMDEVHTARNLHGADAVILIVDQLSSACGKAFIMGTVATTFEPWAFGVVEDSCAADNLGFPHELGHIMSARHDRFVDNTDGSPYDYNHGFTNASAGWRTVMAYNNACSSVGTPCTRLPYWSNPDATYGGAAMGIAAGSANAADNRLTLNNTASTVANFRCTSPGVNNVWMRDTWDDTGQEPDPNTVGQAMWKSPYIWVRNSQDTSLLNEHQHQNPDTALGSSWVYVKLHNGGSATNGTLEVYWANASTGLSWPANWNLLGSSSVGAFAASSTTIVEVPWTSLPGEGHFCLVARWVSPSDPMAVPEGTDIGANVRNNNNIVWRNVNILGGGGDQAMDATFIVRNVNEGPIALFVGPAAEEVNGSFFLFGNGTITLDDVLLEAWRKGGSQGQGFRLLNERDLLVTDPAGLILTNIDLPPLQLDGKVRMRLARTPNTPKRVFHVDAMQAQFRVQKTFTAELSAAAGVGIVGGVSYELRP
jgi:hypothetical protein